MVKFQPPKGTRDFLPEEMIIREYVLETVKKIFESYGFDSFETPAFENWGLLATKCGADILNQIFKFEDKGGRKLGLRFDLTVPLARVVANNPQLPKPFKRYCIGRVWRYEEPQAGRNREFWQADIDVVGSSSMEAEVECIACTIDCFKALGFGDFVVKINNRKILDGLLELVKIEKEGKLDVFRVIDKLDKIGVEGVKKELLKIGLEKGQIEKLFKLITTKGNFEKTLREGKELLKKTEIGKEGLEELEKIYNLGKKYGISNFLELDFSLARGLDYYTGPIFEVYVKEIEKLGAQAAGGRYDDLIELVGGVPTPATGISLGIERIVTTIKTKKINLPKTKVRVFIASVNEKVKDDVIKIAQKLRNERISCQIDLMNRNLTRQLEYADSLGIPFVIIVGQKELENKVFRLKDMNRKTEELLNFDDLIKRLR
jgi:histidyl-tRNA synthetase